ncbi:PD40 domain-containing protein [Ruficoccus amylovorans]|uniref:PD40 domain-containing protein n=1 Tax=Ruficoccus amylovorans TaxID=1804625 RepID=A0A842HI13_9BACT|nr:oligogalacturonate lyase family protein [Ruficoccus amylovorans]MBC2595979.1 PD40 domain-containing protein [Ruficoccus amylovorans]
MINKHIDVYTNRVHPLVRSRWLAICLCASLSVYCGGVVSTNLVAAQSSAWEFQDDADLGDWMSTGMSGLVRIDSGWLTSPGLVSTDPRLFLRTEVPLTAGYRWDSMQVRFRQLAPDGSGEMQPAPFDSAGTVVTFNGSSENASGHLRDGTWNGKGAWANDRFHSTLKPDGPGYAQLYTVTFEDAPSLRDGNISEIRIDPVGDNIERNFEIDYIRLLAMPIHPTSARMQPVPVALPEVEPLRSDWIDPETGHRIIRLSPDTGGESLYFHQRAYTPEGDKVIINTPQGVVAVDISTLGVSPPTSELIYPGGKSFATAWKTREAYINLDDRILAANIDTKAVREVVRIPPEARSRQVALNCDETLVFGVKSDPDGETVPRHPPTGGAGTGSFYKNWAAGTPKLIYALDVKTGEVRVIHRENDWTNHLQASPTDPKRILFCHEGPWHYVDRIWTLRADGSPAQNLHKRIMHGEIAGHEFFSPDGKTVWYDLQTPISGVFWLASVDLETGERTWYNHEREEWSVHYNVSPDGSVFSGDGGNQRSVAATQMDGTPVPGGNGQWIYLFRPVLSQMDSFDSPEDPLIRAGYLKSERLVDMRDHDYDKVTGVEPNATFTPDGKWLVFSGNFDSPRPGKRALTHTYAVEIAPHQP